MQIQRLRKLREFNAFKFATELFDLTAALSHFSRTDISVEQKTMLAGIRWRKVYETIERLLARAGDQAKLDHHLLDTDAHVRHTVPGIIEFLKEMIEKYDVRRPDLPRGKNDQLLLPQLDMLDLKRLAGWLDEFCESAGIFRTAMAKPIQRETLQKQNSEAKRIHDAMAKADQLFSFAESQIDGEQHPNAITAWRDQVDELKKNAAPKLGYWDNTLYIPVSRLQDYEFESGACCFEQPEGPPVGGSCWMPAYHWVACSNCGTRVKTVFTLPQQLERLFRRCNDGTWERGPHGVEINRAQRRIRRRNPNYVGETVDLFRATYEWTTFEIYFDTHDHPLKREAFLNRYVSKTDAESTAYFGVQNALNKKLDTLGVKISNYQIIGYSPDT